MLVGDYLKSKGYSRRIITRIKNNKQSISLNGDHIRMVDKIKEGDELVIKFFDEAKTIANDSLNAKIIFEDDDLIVFDKPANMPTHPSRNHHDDTLGNVFASICKQRRIDIPFRPINRLDRDTTGLLVCAKNSLVASILNGKIDKKYYAVVSGVLKEDCGTINAMIRRVDEDSTGIKREVGEGGQEAITHYKVLQRNENSTVVEVNIDTGRTHQIRVHFASIGHPLVGDSLYGGECAHHDVHQLRCYKVSFMHPITQKQIDIELEKLDQKLIV